MTKIVIKLPKKKAIRFKEHLLKEHGRLVKGKIKLKK